MKPLIVLYYYIRPEDIILGSYGIWFTVRPIKKKPNFPILSPKNHHMIIYIYICILYIHIYGIHHDTIPSHGRVIPGQPRPGQLSECVSLSEWVHQCMMCPSGWELSWAETF